MSEDARDMYRPPLPPVVNSKWCAICDAYTTHHTDRHDDDDLADPVVVRDALTEARSHIRKAK